MLTDNSFIGPCSTFGFTVSRGVAPAVTRSFGIGSISTAASLVPSPTGCITSQTKHHARTSQVSPRKVSGKRTLTFAVASQTAPLQSIGSDSTSISPPRPTPMRPETPNKALQRTAAAVTLAAPPPSPAQPSRHAPRSLSLGSLGVATRDL